MSKKGKEIVKIFWWKRIVTESIFLRFFVEFVFCSFWDFLCRLFSVDFFSFLSLPLPLGFKTWKTTILRLLVWEEKLFKRKKQIEQKMFWILELYLIKLIPCFFMWMSCKNNSKSSNNFWLLLFFAFLLSTHFLWTISHYVSEDSSIETISQKQPPFGNRSNSLSFYHLILTIYLELESHSQLYKYCEQWDFESKYFSWKSTKSEPCEYSFPSTDGGCQSEKCHFSKSSCSSNCWITCWCCSFLFRRRHSN